MQLRNILFILSLCCLQAPIYGQQTLLDENFSDNANGWQQFKAGNISLSISAGHYLISNKSSRDVVVEKAMAIDPARDFQITCTLKQTSGPRKGRFGLVWGMKDFDNFYAFSVSSSKFYNIYTSEERDVFNIKNWTLSEPLKPKGEYNTLEIKKKNDDVRFFINGQQVYYRAFDGFFGGKIGFLASPGVEIAVDRFHISQEEVPISVNPALVYSTPREPLNKQVNSPYKDSRPFVAANGNTLYFVREGHPENAGLRQRMDIWLSEKTQKGDWGTAKPIGQHINNKHDNYVAGIYGDRLLVGETYLAGRTYDAGLAIATNTEDGWQLSEPFKIANFYTNSPQVGYCLSSDEQTLLMTLERDDSFGGRDVYISERQEDGTWGEPQNLGSTINTQADEVSAFLSEDGNTLYYATQGKPGFGSTDIFMAKRSGQGWTTWEEPQNMGPEVNTAGAESSFFIPKNSEFAYFDSSNDSEGGADIFKIRVPEERELPTQEAVAIAERPEATTINVAGYAFDPIDRQQVHTGIIYKDAATGEVVAEVAPDPNSGHFVVNLPAGRKYVAVPKGEGFTGINTTLDLTQANAAAGYHQTVQLISTEGENVVRPKGLLFAVNEARLTEASMIELGKFAIFMAQNPELKVEVGGHTDSTGSEAFNEQLSLQRAEEVTGFLQAVGIEKERMTLKGYGMAFPALDNGTEKGRTHNRRVEFKILRP